MKRFEQLIEVSIVANPNVGNNAKVTSSAGSPRYKRPASGYKKFLQDTKNIKDPSRSAPKKVKKTGIAAVMDRTKTVQSKLKKSPTAANIGSAARSAFSTISKLKDKKEKVDDKKSGMGTGHRQMNRVGAAALKGIMGAKGKYRDSEGRIRDTGGTLGRRLKDRARVAISRKTGIETDATRQARERESQFSSGGKVTQDKFANKRDFDRDRALEKRKALQQKLDGTSPSQMQTALDRAKQMRAGGDNASAKSIMRQVKKRARREGGDREVKNIMRNDQKDLENIGKMESGQQKRLPGSRTSSQKKLPGSDSSSSNVTVNNTGLPMSVRGGVASADRFSKQPFRRTGLGNTKAANQQDDADFEKFLSRTRTNMPGSANRKVTGSGTSSSIVGKKPEAKTNTRRRSAQRMTRGQKLRSTADQLLKKIRNEEFSHWREEFLWEVDKKYPDKVKEIKPMSGKNTIIINPEDETSKYKRGY